MGETWNDEKKRSRIIKNTIQKCTAFFESGSSPRKSQEKILNHPCFLKALEEPPSDITIDEAQDYLAKISVNALGCPSICLDEDLEKIGLAAALLLHLAAKVLNIKEDHLFFDQNKCTLFDPFKNAKTAERIKKNGFLPGFCFNVVNLEVLSCLSTLVHCDSVDSYETDLNREYGEYWDKPLSIEQWYNEIERLPYNLLILREQYIGKNGKEWRTPDRSFAVQLYYVKLLSGSRPLNLTRRPRIRSAFVGMIDDLIPECVRKGAFEIRSPKAKKSRPKEWEGFNGVIKKFEGHNGVRPGWEHHNYVEVENLVKALRIYLSSQFSPPNPSGSSGNDAGPASESNLNRDIVRSNEKGSVNMDNNDTKNSASIVREGVEFARALIDNMEEGNLVENELPVEIEDAKRDLDRESKVYRQLFWAAFHYEVCRNAFYITNYTLTHKLMLEHAPLENNNTDATLLENFGYSEYAGLLRRVDEQSLPLHEGSFSRNNECVFERVVPSEENLLQKFSNYLRLQSRLLVATSAIVGSLLVLFLLKSSILSDDANPISHSHIAKQDTPPPEGRLHSFSNPNEQLNLEKELRNYVNDLLADEGIIQIVEQCSSKSGPMKVREFCISLEFGPKFKVESYLESDHVKDPKSACGMETLQSILVSNKKLNDIDQTIKFSICPALSAKY